MNVFVTGDSGEAVVDEVSVRSEFFQLVKVGQI